MTRRFLLLHLALAAVLTAGEPVTRIACGSCYKPKSDRGVWPAIAATRPELFLFMGDNVYADTTNMDVLRQEYARLTGHPDFMAFRKSVPILPVWDDHDYGLNDAGAEYPMRAESRKVFLDVFSFPADHPARSTPGVYHAHLTGPEGKRLQIILLDTRYFRSPLKRPRVNGRLSYVPNDDPDATMLGEDQWRWLEAELRKPADLRLIVSSIQVITTEHRFEKWANLPRERQRLLDLLKSTGTRSVILLSGDRHLAEFARLGHQESGLPYDLVEFTSSGMTHAGAPNDPNRHRLGEAYRDLNFGTLAIDWTPKSPSVTLAIRDREGQVVREEVVTFPSGSPWTWKQDGHRSLTLLGASGPLARFLVDPKPADPHFDLLATADGRNMVWVAPPDHLWHYGQWFSWKIINGVNFWETDKKTGESQGRTEVLEPMITTKPDHATVSYRRLYRLPEAADPILEDRITITIRPPAGAAGPMVDWAVTTTALADLTLDRTPLPGEPGGQSWGGYCGLSWRGARELQDVRFTDSEGRRDDAIHRQHARWVNALGTHSGKPAGIALLSHPDNPGQPMSWYIANRSDLPFWYANPSLVQPKPIELKSGTSLTHRYRLATHDGSLQPDTIGW